MATNFIDIYSRAMTMLKSPVLSRLQNNNPYDFCGVMNNYLETAITFYNPNAQTESRLANRTDSTYGEALFVGDGQTKEFNIPDATDESIFKVMVGDDVDSEFTFDASTHMLTLATAPAEGVSIDVDWLNDGSFASITNEDITLLAMALCWAWAIQHQNNQLDIDRQPNDSDFKLHAEGTTIKGKIDWVKYYEEMFKRELRSADWRSLVRRSK